MKKQHRFGILLLALCLLLTGCKDSGESAVKPMEELLEKTPASLAEGHFFFAGTVTSSATLPEMISYYETETEKNTFYTVEVTDDFFGCLPDRTLTVCVLGSTENFGSRAMLEKNAEYIFDTSLWVQEEEPVFLLSTFYEALPERSGESLFYTTGQEGKAVVSGSYQDYRARLLALAEEAGYGPELVLSAAKDRLQSAVERDYAYFEALSFTVADSAALAITNQTAAALLDSAAATPASWEGIRGLLLAE